MVNYPGSADVLANPTGSQLQGLTTPTHAGHHANANDILEALEAKLGIGASVAAANQVLRGTGAGATAFGQVQTADITAGHISQVQSGTTGALTTQASTGGYFTIPGLSVPITTTGGQLLIFFNAECVHTTALAAIVSRIMLDTTPLTPSGEINPSTANTRLPFSIVVPYTPAAGSYTLTVQWLTGNASMSMYTRTLIVLELKR